MSRSCCDSRIGSIPGRIDRPRHDPGVGCFLLPFEEGQEVKNHKDNTSGVDTTLAQRSAIVYDTVLILSQR